MVYSIPNIGNDASYFNALVAPASRSVPVEVIYNGSGLHTIAGPVPFVDISQTINRNGAGAIEGHTTRIDITGKIVRTGIDSYVLPGGSGIGPVISGIQQLRDLFSKSNFGILEIKCGVTNTLFSATGVRVLDLTFNKSDNNWLYTADYGINLEYYQPSGLTEGFYVQSTSDNWGIEPMEEALYTNFSQNIFQNGEYTNPLLKPSAPTLSNPIPGTFGGNGTIGNQSLSVMSIPQYRISHRVSAVGIPSGTGVTTANTAYLEAKKWVEQRLSTAFYQSSALSGLGHFFNSSSPSVTNFATNGVYLYNHLRTTNFSVSEGNYEINDTWLAMPTGIAYTEDYSIDSSTDDKFIKTIRVQGQIRGLNISTFAVMTGDPAYTSPGISGTITIKDATQQLPVSDIGSHPILDLATSNGTITTINPNKYLNALSGWMYDIKPYTYKRASLAMRSIDRAGLSYIDSANPTQKPKNPVYCQENLLNPFPTSTAEGHDPRKGTISYSMEYTSKLNLISGAISESINISDTGPTDVFSESFVIGRRLGPVLQGLSARTSTRKDVSIDISVVPPTSLNGFLLTNAECPMYTGGYIYQDIDALIEGLRPFGARNSTYFGNVARSSVAGQVYVTQDNQNWNPSDGRYSRNVSWVYQQCNNSTPYLDQ